MTDEKALQKSSQILMYQSEDGRTRIEVQLQDETVWLTQQLMADLFQTRKQNIGQHLKNIFAERELDEHSVVKKFFTTAADGREYQTFFYNLDAIISVGYRVKSHVATRFRQWATRNNKKFFSKPNLGPTSWRGPKVRKQDVVFAEGQAMRRIPMHMADWTTKLDGFLRLNDRNILGHAGRISHQMARELAETEYDRFHRNRLQIEAEQANAEDFEQLARQIEDKGKGV